MNQHQDLEFCRKCILALATAIKNCEQDSYKSKGIRVEDAFIDDPNSFISHLASLPGSDVVIKFGLNIRRKNQKLGFIKGNIAWHHVQSGIILGSQFAVTQLKEHLNESTSG